MRRLRLALLMVLFLLAIGVGGHRWINRADLAAASEPLVFTPGHESHIADPAMHDGYFTLYVPRDYTAQRKWPVIYGYPGRDQPATLWPFRELCDGQGFIIVGMSYAKDNQRGIEGEWESLRRVMGRVSGSVSVDARRVIVGGFSWGASWACLLSGRDTRTFAGVVILGMSPGVQPDAYRGKRVLLAHGESDEYCRNVGDSVIAFREAGADVTHITFRAMGHTVDVGDAATKRWLAAWSNEPPVPK